jgi:hypothetical protein
LQHITEHESSSSDDDSVNKMDEDEALASEQDKQRFMDSIGELMGEAFLQKEQRKSRVNTINELFN